MNKQLTLSTLTDELGQVATHKKEFLQQINRIIPWDEWKGIANVVSHMAELGQRQAYDLRQRSDRAPVHGLMLTRHPRKNRNASVVVLRMAKR